jgi:hypothetical protein
MLWCVILPSGAGGFSVSRREVRWAIATLRDLNGPLLIGWILWFLPVDILRIQKLGYVESLQVGDG